MTTDAPGTPMPFPQHGSLPPVVTETLYDLANNKRAVYQGVLRLATVFEYDPRHRLSKVIHDDDSFKTMSYDLRGNLIAETNENGFATTHVYNERNLKTDTYVEVGNVAPLHTHTEYNDLGLPTDVVDPRGVATQTAYDSLGRPTRVTQALGRDESVSSYLYYGVNSGASAFDTSGFKPTLLVLVNTATEIDQTTGLPNTTLVDGLITETTYDDLYRPVEVKVNYGDGFAITKTQYDNVGNPVLITDPLNKVTTTIYDGLNRPVKIIYHDQTFTQTEYTTTGLTWKLTDELGRVTETIYDGMGRAVKVIQPETAAGPVEIITIYDLDGRVASTIDPLGHQTDFLYDNRNRKWKTFLPPIETAKGVLERPVTETRYDAVGNLRFVIDPKGNVTETVYDGANRAVLAIDAKKNQTRTVYDPNGNILVVKDGNNNYTINTYDALNRLSTTTDAEKVTVENEYDSHGNRTAMITLKDGLPVRMEFNYDGLGRLRKTTFPDGTFEKLVYNEVYKTKRIDRKGEETQFAVYDDRHRLKTMVLPDENERNFTYDGVGNITSVTESLHNGRADVSYSYDEHNRVLNETTLGVTHQFVYDQGGNRIQTTVGGAGRVITAAYDAHGKIKTLSEEDRSTDYFYDINGNLRERAFSNGQKVLSTYDELNRLVSRVATNAAELLQSFSYRYDAVGNVVEIAERYGREDVPDRTTRLNYDRVYRLKNEMFIHQDGSTQITTYDYDDASNRVGKTVLGKDPSTTTSVYNDLNQLTSFTNHATGVTTIFDYDDNGNRTKRISGSEVTDYSYDPDNRLIAVSEAGKKRVIDITGPNGAKTKATFIDHADYDYDYDYRTRRIARTENGVKTDIVFLGGTSVMEFEGPGNGVEPDRAPGAVPTVEYIRGSDLGGGIGGILYSLRNGQASFTWYNNRGDVVAKTNDGGALTYQAAYEAFGTRTAEGGSTEDRQRANTREETAWGGLYENMRWRDLETGTYLTPDPAGFVDGPNLYAYVRQNPWSKFDPHGLAEEPPERLPKREVGYFEGERGKSTFHFDKHMQPELKKNYPKGIPYVDKMPDLRGAMPSGLSARGVQLKTTYEIELTGDTTKDTNQVRKEIRSQLMSDLEMNYKDADKLMRDTLKDYRLHHHLKTNKIIVVDKKVHSKLAHIGARALTAMGKLKAGANPAMKLLKGLGIAGIVSDPVGVIAGPATTMGDATLDGHYKHRLYNPSENRSTRVQELNAAKTYFEGTPLYGNEFHPGFQEELDRRTGAQ